MRYYANPSTPAIRAAMTEGKLAAIVTPRQRLTIPPGAAWCADNGCYGKGYPGDEAWLAWLESYPLEDRARCGFATAPDVVGDHAATLARSLPHLSAIRTRGYRAAFVVQNGATVDGVPWDELDVVFVGGVGECHEHGPTLTPTVTGRGAGRRAACPTCGRTLLEWKDGPQAAALIAEARRRGKGVHVGRVNGARRLRRCAELEVDSVDGTFLTFGPDVNLPRLLGWLEAGDARPTLEQVNVLGRSGGTLARR